jgi:2'-5' RNA ligase
MDAIAPDVWQISGAGLRQPGGVVLPSSATVFRRPDRSLLVYSPVDFDDATAAAIDAAGEVAHIVAPSRLHHLFAAAAKARWPRATMHAAPGVAEKQPALQHLHDKVESAVVRAGMEPDGQKYVPHVTLTRPKDTPLNKLQHYLAEHSLFKTEPFEVTHFTLYSSEMGGEQSVYTALRSYALSTPNGPAEAAAEKREML